MNTKQLAENAKVLMIGTGGIGCELLKCLALTGFKNVDIVDMDTIEVSNLNRQFLFRREHVGKSKVEVAQETMKHYFPDMNINVHFSNIISEEFSVKWFQQFSVVMNALDNMNARSHVNRMCLAAEVPLIDSGTAGFFGQVEVIMKGKTKCYECDPRIAPKSYPSCTIRSTPTEPIHCIIWAKHLFAQLFGEGDDDTNVSPDTANPELAGSSANSAFENVSADTGAVKRISTKNWAKQIDYNPIKLFNKFFYEDILYLLSLGHLWYKRVPPTPLNWDEAIENHSVEESNEEVIMEDQKLWSIAQCVEKFKKACYELREKLHLLEEIDEKAILTWDKDDNSSMDFVAACSNIRSYVFHIQRKTRYDTKSMAGNIIPAIATSNAIVAGLVIFQVMHILRKTPEKCRTVYLRELMNHRGVFISAERFSTKPNPNCFICSVSPEVTLYVDVQRMTIRQLREDVFIKYFKMVEPEVMVESTNSVIISSDDEMDEQYYSKILYDVNVKEYTVLKVDDYFQNCSFSICVKEMDIALNDDEEEDEVLFRIKTNQDFNPMICPGLSSENGQAENSTDKTMEANVPPPYIDYTIDDDIVYVGNAQCRMGTVVQQKKDKAFKRPFPPSETSSKKHKSS